MKTKAELLAHYAQKFPNTFCQIDAFEWTPGEHLADEDGDAMFKGFTDELMNGAAVRVLIPEGFSAQAAARLLRKITRWIETQDDSVLVNESEPAPEGEPTDALAAAIDLVWLKQADAESTDLPFEVTNMTNTIDINDIGRDQIDAMRAALHQVALSNQDIIEAAYAHAELIGPLIKSGEKLFMERANCYLARYYQIKKWLDLVPPEYLAFHRRTVEFYQGDISNDWDRLSRIGLKPGAITLQPDGVELPF